MNSIEPIASVINLNLSLIPLVTDYLSGASMDECAAKFNIDVVQVSEFLDRREVKRYISNELKSSGYASRKKRLDVLSRIVDQKLDDAEENELPLSNKDIIEVMKLLREENNDLEKLSGNLEEDTGKAAYINIINSLRVD